MSRYISAFVFAVCIIAVLGTFATIAQTPAKGQVPTFQPDPSWPAIPNNWVFGAVSSVSVDSRDHIWILQRPATIPDPQRANAEPPVLEVDAAGKFIQGWGGPGSGYDWPEREHGIYVDPKNTVWIGGNNGYGTPLPPGDSDDMLLKFTTAGKFLLQVGRRNSSTGNADTKNLHQPADAFFHDGEVFVADGYGNHRVIVLNSETGAFKRMWGAFGNTPTADTNRQQFGLVHAIKVSKDGLVYVADRSNQRIQVFTLGGKFVTETTVGKQGQTAAGLALS